MASITTFKHLANLTHDNTEAASKEWGKTWGMSWWRSLWRYKEYTATTSSGRSLVYRTGSVYTRHTHYSVTEFEVDGKEVGKTAFLKAVDNILSTEGFVRYQRPVEEVASVTAPSRRNPEVVQMTLFA